jgi:hypothetical protein
MKTVIICIACFTALILTYIYIDQNVDKWWDCQDNIYAECRTNLTK